LDEILEEHKLEYALPEEAANELINTAFVYLSTWYSVFLHYKDGDVPLFGLTGKGHILMHSCLLSRSGPCFLKFPKGF
jgi:hypothetical protein